MHATSEKPTTRRSGLPEQLAGAKPWIRLVARVGFASIGFIHIIVGVLAIRLAIGLGGGAESLRTALTMLHGRPFGGIMLVILAVGFLCYAAWMYVLAIWDPDHVGRTRIGNFFRFGFFCTGCVFLGLAGTAMRVVLLGGGDAPAAENQKVESATATLLAHAWGQALIVAVVLVLGGMAAGSFVHAWRARFREQLTQRPMSDAMRHTVTALGRLAYLARGLVFSAAAWLFARAAYEADPSQAGGMSDAMSALLRQPHGSSLLAIAGAGFVAYGLFSWSMIPYRRLPGASRGR